MGVQIHGKLGLKLQSGGELTTQRHGLVTGRLVFLVEPGKWNLMPQIGSPHPHAAFCTLEGRSVRFTRGFWTVTCDYTGSENEASDPVYGFSPGVGTEPIETHPDFLKIGGKPSDPKNGAIWRDENGDKTKDDKRGIFDRFLIHLPDGGEISEMAGVSDYLVANNSRWTKRWVSKSKPPGANDPLKIVKTPPGGAPEFGGKYDWLEHPVAFEKRGKVYDNTQEWLLSGPKGWKKIIYPGDE